jgi:hypothetical protein
MIVISVRRILVGCAALLFWTACPSDSNGEGSPAALDKSPPVVLKRTEGSYQATLQLHTRRGVINLWVEQASGGSAASVPVVKRVSLWRPLLEQMFAEHGKREQYALTVDTYPELAPRLAAGAAKSDDWNLETGHAASGEATEIVAELLSKDVALRS